MISRQVRKTIEAIKTEESIPTRKVIGVLEALGFTRRAGEHQNWRHPKGHRYTLPFNPGPELYGYRLKDIRALLEELGFYSEESTEMVIEGDKTKVKLGREDVKHYYDTNTLAERSFKQMNKIDLKAVTPQTPTGTTGKEVLDYLKKIGSMVQSVQEYLINLGTDIEDVKGILSNPIAQAPQPDKPQKLSKEEAQAARYAARQAQIVKNIKAVMAENPTFKNNDAIIATLAKSTPATVKKYREQGLI